MRAHVVRYLVGVLTLWVASTHTVSAQPADAQAVREEVQRLRREFETLRQDYGARLATLESKLASLEGKPQPPPDVPPPQISPTPTEAQVPAGAAGAGGPTGALPVYGNVSVLSKIFNPDIAVIGDFLGAAGKNDVNPQPSFEMHEAEASFQAIVDPYARADFFFAFGQEGVEIEEGYITFPTLPGGLLAKVGKLRAAFGKVNTMHNHMLPWTDRPLVIENLVGGEEGIADAGLSVSRLLPNPWFFLEVTGEVYRGTSAVFEGADRNDLTYVGRVRGYRDVTEASNFELGTSFATGTNDPFEPRTTRLFGVDATFRYRPLRRAIYSRFLGRTELVWRRDEDFDSVFGAYVSGDYQFARRWFLGGRYDRAERVGRSFESDKGGSVLLTFWPSEFSQVRGQYRHVRYAEGRSGNELLFQALFSIGAHGAHPF